MTSDPPVAQEQDQEIRRTTTPEFETRIAPWIAVTTGVEDTDPETLIRLCEEVDIPIFKNYCHLALDKHHPDILRTCGYCSLALTGFVVWKDGRRLFNPLPEKPRPNESFACPVHKKRICPDCDIYIETITSYNVWEWNPKDKEWREWQTDVYDPFKHGFLSKAEYKREKRERRLAQAEKEAKRPRKQYDAANSRARKTLNKLNGA